MGYTIEHLTQLVLEEIWGKISREDEHSLLEIVEEDQDAFIIREAMHKVLEPEEMKERRKQLAASVAEPVLEKEAKERRLGYLLQRTAFALLTCALKCFFIILLLKYFKVI